MTNSIALNSRVKIHYRIECDSAGDLSGVEAEVTFVQGEGRVLPEIEEALIGKKSGDRVELTLTPQHSFGAHDPKAVIKVPIDKIPDGENCLPGSLLAAKDKQGQPFTAIVREVHADHAMLDLNHPYAGQNVVLKVEVLAVEPL